MDLVKAYQEDFEKCLPALSGSSKTRARRKEAIEAFQALGMPHRRMEDWRYSDLSSLGKKRFQSRPALDRQTLDIPNPVTDWPRLVFLNGQLIEGHSDQVSDPGLEILTTSEALDGPAWTKALLESSEENALENLNLAFANGGFALRVQKDAKIEGLEILFLFEGEEDDACHIRNLVVMDPGSRMSLFVQTQGTGAFGWQNLVNRLVINEGASLDYHMDFNSASPSILTSSENLSIHGGKCSLHSLLTDAGVARQTITANILAENSDLNLAGAMLAGDGANINVLTRVNHVIGHSYSDQSFRAVAAKGGKTAFQGRVTVAKDAQKTNANQSSRNLLLDAGAEANIKPELIINADDVKCSHGATVGELDQDVLFYLMQRGLAPEEAKRLLIGAFIAEVIDPINDAKIREALGQKIEDRLGQLLSEASGQ